MGDLNPDDPDALEIRLAIPLAEAMRTQRAVRRVRPDPVADDVVLRCVELALEAPTGSNRQNWEFVVVKDSAVKAALGTQYRLAWTWYGLPDRLREPDDETARMIRSVKWQVDHFEEIPVLVVCCLRGSSLAFMPRAPVVFSSHYGSIYPSVQNLLLAARAVGLGGALITLPLWSDVAARQILRLPPNVDPCCIVTLGWPKGRYGRKRRRPVEGVVHLDQYGRQPWQDKMRE